MKRREESFEKTLQHSFECSATMPDHRVDLAWGNVLRRFRENETPNGAANIQTVQRNARWGRPVLRMATILLVGFILVTLVRKPASNAPQARVIDGSFSRVSGSRAEVLHAGQAVPFGDIVHSNAGNGLLSLADGSVIEMRSQSELSLERADDGIRIRLKSGGVIVNAVKQRTGHLYVQTKDLKVSVVGTVFLVNADESGSRVAVIEGEVQVRQGTQAKTLLPGDQVSTSPAMPFRLVVEEIGWSRNATTHLLLLQKAAAESLDSAASPAFEAAVIKRNGPDSPIERKGGGCHGVGTKDVRLVSRVPRGRCVLSNLTLKDMIWVVHPDLPRSLSTQQVVLGGPAWTGTEEFNVEGKAEDASGVTEDQLLRMLRVFLGQKFSLRFHLESRETSGYTLTIAKGGVRLKETPNGSGQGAFRTVPGQSGLWSTRGRDIGMFNLVGFLAYQLKTPVLDKTNLSGAYDIDLSWALLNADNSSAGPSIFAAVRDLGLELQSGKGPSEVLVIDHAERPSEN